jgi:hypothetical protein
MFWKLLVLGFLFDISETFLCSVCSSSKNCPFARRASAANVVSRDVDIFGTKTLSLKHIVARMWRDYIRRVLD